MERSSKVSEKVYSCIVIGAGASGLFYAAADSETDRNGGRKLILEKTSRPGQKLLMSGNGMCNITHAGPIKDFIGKYGDNGRLIRSCLYKHSNIELMKMMQDIGVPLITREDGKVFPASMKARDVLDALLTAVNNNNWEIRIDSQVTAIHQSEHDKENIDVTLSDGAMLRARKLVIATGGASYPSTGSDGTFFDVLSRDLGLDIVTPAPALTPVFAQDFKYEKLAGVSFDDVRITLGKHVETGPMLITHRGFSGPAVLHISQYVHPGDTMTIGYLPDLTSDELLAKIKSDMPGNKTGAANYIAAEFGIPKAFSATLFEHPGMKLSSVGMKEIKAAAMTLIGADYSVSGTGGWNDSMVTRGGVSLDEIDLKTMRVKDTLYDIRIIGEALDINGNTGGYNLQFAYSSAIAAH